LSLEPDRLEVVSGHGASQSWKEISGGSLPRMFQVFRKTFAAELTKRFKLDTTPSSHVQLALQMNPSINVSVDGPLLIGKSAFYETMHACYRRALKRQALTQSTAPVLDTAAPAPAPAANPSDAPIDDAPTAGEPLLKKRRSLLGVVVAKQGLDVVAQGEGDSLLDTQVSAEVERFEQIRLQILAKGLTSNYYCEKGHRFNLRQFWADHKAVLPIHYAVYLAEIGCKKSAAVNIESVFSGAGKFTAEAPSTGSELLSRIVKLHYNWKYLFLRPTMSQIIER